MQTPLPDGPRYVIDFQFAQLFLDAHLGVMVPGLFLGGGKSNIYNLQPLLLSFLGNVQN